MNQISLLTELVYQQKRQELLGQVAEYRLMNEAAKANSPARSVISRILAWAGRQMQYVGFALEERYGEQFTLKAPYNQAD